MVNAFCQRAFGRYGLPWVAAIHEPDAAGDHRNHHAHIAFSTRPSKRVGPGEWELAQEKVTEIADKRGLMVLRAFAAAHMNQACDKVGLPARFTHLKYEDRGIEGIERQEHVGAAAMAAFRRGETVPVVERNAARVERNELRLGGGRRSHARLSGWRQSPGSGRGRTRRGRNRHRRRQDPA